MSLITPKKEAQRRININATIVIEEIINKFHA